MSETSIKIDHIIDELLEEKKFATIKDILSTINASEVIVLFEHIDKKESEHDDYEVHACNAGEVELKECRRNGSGHGDDSGGNDAVEACFGVGYIEADQLAEDAEDPCGEDAEKDRTLDIAQHKDRGDQNADDGQKYCDTLGIESAVLHGRLKGKYRDQRGAVHDDVGVLQSDEGDEEADTDGYGELKCCRDRIEDRFSDARQGENYEDYTLDEDSGQCHLPGISHSQYNGVCKISVEAHACGEYERKIGEEGHQERGDRRCQSRCCKDRA